MKYQFIDSWRAVYDVRRSCRVLGVSSSGYYAWRTRYASARDCANHRLLDEVRTAHMRSRQTYGSPRVTRDLCASGIVCGKNRIARLMHIHGIVAKTKRRFKVTTQSHHTLPVAENLVRQEFVASTPNRLWTSDITYLWTTEGWVYLAVVLDVFSRMIVGWAMSARLTSSLVVDALQQAVDHRRPGTGLVFHSDRGSQYASHEVQTTLHHHGFSPSMGSTGSCYDNAITESFFHTLKTEHVYHTQFKTRDDARLQLFDYIEIFYNRQRRHSSINYLSPVAFEHSLTHT